MNRFAEHNSSPFGGFRDPILLAHNARIIANGHAMVANASSMRTVWGREATNEEPDPRMNLAEECGYPRFPTAELFGWLYLTDAIAARVVEFMARQAWQVKPTVKEGEDEEGTPFLDSWWELNRSIRGGEDNGYFPRNSHALFRKLETFDILMGIGDYGVLYYALDDGIDPSKPVAGWTEEGSRPAAKDEKAKQTIATNGNGKAHNIYKLTRNEDMTKGRKLLQVQALPEALAKVVAWETNKTSPRNGMPVLYQITRVDPDRNWSGSMPPMSNEYVHWTRIVHGIDTSSHASSSECFGNSRLRSVLPEVLDGRKISGADGMAFVRNAFMKIFLESNPQLGGDVLFNRSQTADDFENMMNGFQQWMFLRGLHANAVAPAVVDPSPHQKAKIERICVKYGWPVRIFVGSERGELASSQDEVQHRDNVRQHEEGHVSEEVIAPAINRLVAVGVLEKWGEDGYNFNWPEIGSQDPEKKARVFSTNMQGLAAAAQQQLLSDKDVLIEMGKTAEEAEVILEENEKEMLAEEEDAIAQGLKPAAPEGFIDPEQQDKEHEIELEKAKAGGGASPFGGKPDGGGNPFQKKPKFAANEVWMTPMDWINSLLQEATLILNFDPDQPRDEDGRWSGGGGVGGEGERFASKFNPEITYGSKEDRNSDDAHFTREIKKAQAGVDKAKKDLETAKAKLEQHGVATKAGIAAIEKFRETEQGRIASELAAKIEAIKRASEERLAKSAAKRDARTAKSRAKLAGNQEWWDKMEQARNANDFFSECERDEGGHCVGGGGTPSEKVKSAIEHVSKYREDMSGDAALADSVVEAVMELDKDSMFKALTEAGLDGIKRGDSKVKMVRRLHQRITAPSRARSRSEV